MGRGYRLSAFNFPIVESSQLAPRAAGRHDRLVRAQSLPVIDLGDAGAPAAIREACTNYGFFYVIGHPVSASLLAKLEELSREFFSREPAEKHSIRMELGGRAWRGYFPVGAELTSGSADQKEGLYFGSELPATHPKVLQEIPLHGANLFPDSVPGFRETVLEYMDALTSLGHSLMEAVALSLELDPHYFSRRYTHDPLVLFRVFNYPALPDPGTGAWSVAEHTDYGLLTILLQDDRGGLEVKAPARGSHPWISAPPIEGSFVCNIGDMLERMTGGVYRSTPHRVRNTSGHDRLSFPFFFDPNWDVKVHPIAPRARITNDAHERWDHASVHDFEGTYGDYVLKKVSAVFPDLRRGVL